MPMKKEAGTTSAEALTIELKAAGKAGTFVLTWGTTVLSADFTLGR